MINARTTIGKAVIFTIMLGLLCAPLVARNAMALVSGGLGGRTCTQDCDCNGGCGAPANITAILEVNGPWCLNGFCQDRNTLNTLPLGATCSNACQCDDALCDPTVPYINVPGQVICDSCGPIWDGKPPWTGADAPYSHHPLGVCTTDHSFSNCGSKQSSIDESPPAPEMSDYLAGSFLLVAGGIVYLIRRRMLGG